MANGESFEIPAGQIVVETAVDMQGLEQDMKDLEKRGEQAGEEAGKKFGEGFEKSGVAESASKATEGIREIGEGAKKTEEEITESSGALSDWASTADEAAHVGGGLALVMRRKLIRGLRGLKGAVVGGTSALVSLAGTGVRVVGEGLRDMGVELEDAESALAQRFSPALKTTGTILSGVAGKVEAVARKITLLKLSIFGASAAMDVKMAGAADEFRGSWNRVLTLIPEGVDGLDDLRREVDQLGASLGLTSKTTNDTFYQVLSAMPEMTRKPAEALDILEVALETAATGFADGETAAKAITGTLNAFQMEADQAREVTDKLFAAQQQGVLTFQDVASEINKVSGITNALGGDFEDLLAIVATMTGEFSARVPETFTQLRGVIRSIASPTDAAAQAAREMGEDFALSADLIREHGLIGAIERIVEVTEGNPEAIAQIIPRANAQQLIVSLAGRMEGLDNRLQNILETSDLTAETLEETEDSWKRQREIFGARFQSDLRAVGELYNEVRIQLLGYFNAVRDASEQSILQDVRESGFDILDLLGQIPSTFGRMRDAVQNFVTEGLGGAPATMEEVESRADRLERAVERLEDAGQTGRLPEMFDRLDVTTETWAEELIDSESKLERLEKGVERIVGQANRLEESMGRAFAQQLPPEAARVLGMDPEQMRQEAEEGQTGEIDRPERPGQRSGEFQVAAIEAARARREVEAFREFLETGNEEAYQRRLEAIGREVNQLVRERVRLMAQHGAEAEQIQQVVSLYDSSIEKVDILSDEFAGLEDSLRGLADAMGTSLEGGAPLPPGFEDPEELAAAASDVESRLQRVRTALEEMENAEGSQREKSLELTEVLNAQGLEWEDLTRAIKQNIIAIIGWENAVLNGLVEPADEGSDSTQKLANELQKVAETASGVLNLADAMGILGEESRQTLRGISEIAGAAASIAEGGLTPSNVIRGVGGVAQLIGGLLGGGVSEQEKEMEKLTEALRKLRSSVQAVRSVFDAVPGEKIDQFRRFFEGLTTEPADLFGATSGAGGGTDVSELEGGDFLGRLRQMGLEFSDLEQLADALGIEIDDLETAFEGGAASTNQMIDEINALREAVRELQLERLTETFAGQLDMLRQEFELFDIEEPADKLERMRSLFLEFTDLPAEMEAELAGADLSTAEGRRQFEQVLQELFRQLEAGELEPGALGDLTLDQFRDMLSELEGLGDKLGEEADGETTSFQQVSTIQEVTAEQMLGTLTTISFLNDQQLEVQRSILALLSGDRNLGDLSAGVPAAPTPTSPAGGMSVTIEDLVVESPPLPDSVDSPAAARRFGREQGRGVADGLSERLADHRLDFEQAQGRRRPPERE